MRTIIAGSRTIIEYEYVQSLFNACPWEITEVVCGMATGVDELGERWAIENKIPIKYFPAEWRTYGRRAGPIRNRQMADNADALLIVWDGKSRGSKSMISIAAKMGLDIKEHIVIK